MLGAVYPTPPPGAVERAGPAPVSITPVLSLVAGPWTIVGAGRRHQRITSARSSSLQDSRIHH